MGSVPGTLDKQWGPQPDRSRFKKGGEESEKRKYRPFLLRKFSINDSGKLRQGPVGEVNQGYFGFFEDMENDILFV